MNWKLFLWQQPVLIAMSIGVGYSLDLGFFGWMACLFVSEVILGMSDYCLSLKEAGWDGCPPEFRMASHGETTDRND